MAFAVVGALSYVGGEALGKQKTWVLSALVAPSGTAARGTVANDVSDSGYIGGAWVGANVRFHAAYWYRGAAHDIASEIGIPAGTTYSYVASVNSNGLMGGRASDASGWTAHGVLWHAPSNTFVDVHPPGDQYLLSSVTGVNAPGDAAGWVYTLDGLQLAWVWPKGDTVGMALPVPDDFPYAWVNGINSSGTMVGTVVDGWDFSYHAAMWEPTAAGYAFTNLQPSLGDVGGVFPESEATDVGEDGTVVGVRYPPYDPAVTETAAFSWSAHEGVDDDELETGPDGHSIAWKTVGKYVAGGTGFGRYTIFGSYARDTAVVWVDGEREVIATAFGTRNYVEAESINRSGLAVGVSLGDADNYPQAWSAEKK